MKSTSNSVALLRNNRTQEIAEDTQNAKKKSSALIDQISIVHSAKNLVSIKYARVIHFH